MVELLVAGSLIAAVAAVTVSRGPTPSLESNLTFDQIAIEPDPDGPDLPCPWCEAPTLETDEHCPTCRRKFG